MAIDGFVGESAIETSAGGATVNVVVPVTLPEVALICDAPCAAPLASPPAVIVAAAVFDDAQVAELVTSSVVPSE